MRTCAWMNADAHACVHCMNAGSYADRRVRSPMAAAVLACALERTLPLWSEGGLVLARMTQLALAKSAVSDEQDAGAIACDDVCPSQARCITQPDG
eukprot:362038-Chlamydomonas_euryale.AAC.1